MTAGSVHQESAVPLRDEPSLFVEEWVDRCIDLIHVQIEQGIKPSKAACRQLRQAHPPLFLGVWTSPGLLRQGVLDDLPRLRYADDQLWLDPDWGVEPAHPVKLLRVRRHRLVILVTMDSLLVLRESELVAALGGQPIGGVR